MILFSDCRIDPTRKLENTFYHYCINRFERFSAFAEKVTSWFLETETRNTRRADFANELLASVEHGRKIIIVSDFYFGSVFVGLLAKEFPNLSCEVFVSCDHGRCKEDGTLFELIEYPSGAIMIGDNQASDCDWPL